MPKNPTNQPNSSSSTKQRHKKKIMLKRKIDWLYTTRICGEKYETVNQMKSERSRLAYKVKDATLLGGKGD